MRKSRFSGEQKVKMLRERQPEQSEASSNDQPHGVSLKLGGELSGRAAGFLLFGYLVTPRG